MTIQVKEVPLCRKRVLLLLFVSLAYLAVGALLAVYAGKLSVRNPAVIGLVGVSISAFSGLGVLEAGRKLLQDRPGLRFDSGGFDDFSSLAAAGRVEWKEVSRLKVRAFVGEQFISVELVDPSRLFKSGPFWIRSLRVVNHRLFGSPVQISSKSIDIRHDELVQTFESYVEKSAYTA